MFFFFFKGSLQRETEARSEQMLYLHLAAVVGYDEAEQDDGGEADDGLEGEGVDGALWEGRGVPAETNTTSLSADDASSSRSWLC